MKHSVKLIGALAIILFLASCDKDDDDQEPVAFTKTTTITVNFNPGTPFTLYSFKDSSVVANSDSVSAKWDFALRLTTFLVNSNAGGPGNAGVIMQDGIYDNITVAPTAGYAYDTSGSQRAIKDGSWYDYDVVSHNFIPKAGKVFIFRTADGVHYSKMEILSATYAPFTGPVPDQIIYTIRFTYQPAASVNF